MKAIQEVDTFLKYSLFFLFLPGLPVILQEEFNTLRQLLKCVQTKPEANFQIAHYSLQIANVELFRR